MGFSPQPSRPSPHTFAEDKKTRMCGAGTPSSSPCIVPTITVEANRESLSLYFALAVELAFPRQLTQAWRSVMRACSVCIWVCFMVFVAACAGQAASGAKKLTRKTPQSAPSLVACPEPETQKACKSYEELVRAKDTGLPGHAYVCFRKDSDEFFVISFTEPYFLKHWDRELKEVVIDTEQTRPGGEFARTYRNGVEDSSVPPSLFYRGRWSPYGESGLFASEKINFKKQDENDPEVGVSIDENQLNVGYKYQNRFEKTITYSLTIQRSTGRFAESFRSESDKVPFSDSAGRCVFRKD